MTCLCWSFIICSLHLSSETRTPQMFCFVCRWGVLAYWCTISDLNINSLMLEYVTFLLEEGLDERSVGNTYLVFLTLSVPKVDSCWVKSRNCGMLDSIVRRGMKFVGNENCFMTTLWRASAFWFITIVYPYTIRKLNISEQQVWLYQSLNKINNKVCISAILLSIHFPESSILRPGQYACTVVSQLF